MKNLPRVVGKRLQALANQFPAVLILGPRQCGKTTLVRHAVAGRYYDLERPSDRQVFEADPELALSRLRESAILDEAQTLPALFPVLRALIDENRRHCGRFYLLGSVNPALVREISESLAGRVGVLELTPFLYPEVHGRFDLPTFWHRGGFPDALLAANTEQWGEWQESYVRTFVERDLARYHQFSVSPLEMRRFTTMLAHLHGGLLNASELGRAFGVSYHTVQRYLDAIEGHYLIRRLMPYAKNTGRRLVKSPKVYIRDTGLLHHLLGIRDENELLAHPKRGFSWEGCMIEQLIALFHLSQPGAQFSFYRTQMGAEIDLVVEYGGLARGFEFKTAMSVGKGDASGLRAGLTAGVIHEGAVVYLGSKRYPLAPSIEALPAADLLAALTPAPTSATQPASR
jgi:predicted AAA+ superfamily ATPase